MRKVFSGFFFVLVLFYSAGLWAQGFAGQALGKRDLSAFQLPAQSQLPSLGTKPSNFLGDQNKAVFNPSQIPLGGMSGIPDLGYQIHVLGNVVLPGTYRLPPSTRIAEAIGFAGGATKTGSKRTVELRRKQQIKRYDLIKFELEGDLSNNPFLLDNDIILVPFAEKNVEIFGPVKHPGVFEMVGKDRSLSNLIEMSGGFTAGVDLLESIKIIRYIESKKEVLSVMNSASELSRFELENGDIIIIPHVLGRGRDYDYNVSSLPADNVFYPSYNNNVYVVGAVALPGSFAFNSHYSVQDFMNMSGPQKEANKHAVYILKPDGTRIRRILSNKKYNVSPGDTIVVPERAFRSDNFIKWYSTITSSIISGFTIYQLTK